MDNPLTWESIHTHQLNDTQCQFRHRMNPEDHQKQTLDSFELPTTRVRKPRNKEPDTGAVQPREAHVRGIAALRL